ncbi:hypothetical protein EDEG_02085 [Edhazardia aedis USNM 41457]|uniref:Uncharacterized protein n=1 Tax=Edhazardia aedis (strain USNM 41457) TaxID=1003232 RepID=J9DLY5_EDHAE|nr:hypothetical protein EDEG_02085 [Edhazardia aedis USNM 41457]|eukprot:EJW03595.1 hypothetical protein EDEG_02085 [Edhazardia aedis USNM 41457]
MEEEHNQIQEEVQDEDDQNVEDQNIEEIYDQWIEFFEKLNAPDDDTKVKPFVFCGLKENSTDFSLQQDIEEPIDWDTIYGFLEEHQTTFNVCLNGRKYIKVNSLTDSSVPVHIFVEKLNEDEVREKREMIVVVLTHADFLFVCVYDQVNKGMVLERVKTLM